MRASMIKEVDRADGTKFQVYARRSKRKVYVGTYETRRDAEEAEEDFRVTSRKIARGELPVGADDKRTLSEGILEWLTQLEREQSRSEEVYRRLVTNQVFPWLGNRQLSSISSAEMRKWRDACHQRFAAATVNTALAAVSSAFTWFIDEKNWVAMNPCLKIKRLKQRDERLYAWIRTVPEVERLLLHSNNDFRDIFAVALGTGMRLDEILHLQWVDVDLEQRLLTVQRGRKGPTKSGKMRHVPIFDAVLPVLRDRHLKRGQNMLVFPSPAKSTRTRAGSRVRNRGVVRAAFKLALENAELDKSIRFHDLRHTFASHWVINGGDIFRLSRILGHASVQMTERVYAHLSPTAWIQDYGRVAFKLPADAKVIRFERGDVG